MDDLVYGSLFHRVLGELNVRIKGECINRGKNAAHTYCEKREEEKETVLGQIWLLFLPQGVIPIIKYWSIHHF
jgi:hypothetical protein